MPEAPDSPEIFGPCKRKLSEKATNNGDPNMERKRKRLEQQAQKTGAPTKKHTQSSSKTIAPAKTAAPTKVMALHKQQPL